MNLIKNRQGDKVEGFALLKTFDKKVSRNGSTFVDMLIGDKGGDLSAKIWDYNPAQHDKFVSGMIVKIRGVVSQYNGADQISVNLIRESAADDNINPEDFVLGSPYRPEDMLEKLISFVSGFKNDDYKKITLAILEENRDRLLLFPAAVRMHHAMMGGLLYHTMSVLELAKKAAEIYSFIDSELLFTGAILHDIAKIEEYVVNDVGNASEYTPEGVLLGHLVKGAMYVEKKAEELKVSKETAMLIEHMILSHHGQPEFGCAVKPATIEAELLAMLDMMDAKVYQIAEALGKAEEGKFTDKLWGLDSKKFYKHDTVENFDTIIS